MYPEAQSRRAAARATHAPWCETENRILAYWPGRSVLPGFGNSPCVQIRSGLETPARLQRVYIRRLHRPYSTKLSPWRLAAEESGQITRHGLKPTRPIRLIEPAVLGNLCGFDCGSSTGACVGSGVGVGSTTTATSLFSMTGSGCAMGAGSGVGWTMGSR